MTSYRDRSFLRGPVAQQELASQVLGTDYLPVITDTTTSPRFKRATVAAIGAAATGCVDPRSLGASATATPATNVAALRAAMVECLALGVPLYLSEMFPVNNNLTFDGDWSGLGVFGNGPHTGLEFGTEIDEASNVEAGWMMILDGASNGALENFRASNFRLNGNRAGVVGFDTVGNTTQGVVVYPNSDCSNVEIEGVTTHSFLVGSGFAVYAGGVRLIDCLSYDNDYHGGFASRASAPTTHTFGQAAKVVEWINFTAHDNGQVSPFDGCGLDAGRYCRSIVTNLNSYRNGQGMKLSIGTELLVVRGARLAHNLFNGFQDTDTTGGAILDLDGIVTHHNGGIGFRLVSGSSVRIGSVLSHDNWCRTGAQVRATPSTTAWATATAYTAADTRILKGVTYYCTVSHTSSSATEPGVGAEWRNVWREEWFTGGTLNTAGDIHLGTNSPAFLTYFTADSLRSLRSPTNGIYIDGDVRGYTIRYLESVRAQYAGFADYAQQTYSAWLTATAYTTGQIRSNGGVNYLCTSSHTSGAGTEPGVGGSWTTVWQAMTTDGVVESGLMLENNQRAAASAGAACAIIAERLGSLRLRNILLRDNQAVPTQHSGMFFTSGIVADLDMCHFGSGMVAAQEIYSSSTGTRVRFGHNNSGTLVTRARGAATANGGGTTASVTYPTAISNLGGATFVAFVSPTSADASEAHYISAASRTALTITCPGTFGGGAGTVTFNYDVQMEVQR